MRKNTQNAINFPPVCCLFNSFFLFLQRQFKLQNYDELLDKNQKNHFFGIKALVRAFCAKRYVLVFKSERKGLKSPTHTK